jgi:hypothetical protein
MSTKPLTNAALMRKVARLEARLAELEGFVEKQNVIIRENLYGVVDAEMRIKQAIAVLNGGDA